MFHGFVCLLKCLVVFLFLLPNYVSCKNFTEWISCIILLNVLYSILCKKQIKYFDILSENFLKGLLCFKLEMAVLLIRQTCIMGKIT